MHLKKTILILIGISIILVGTIFVLYKNYQNKNEEVITSSYDNFGENEVLVLNK